MKRLIFIFLITVVSTVLIQAQPKVNVYLSMPRISNPGGYWKIDVMATVLAGQTWRVGSSNIRVDWVTVPANKVSIKADNPAINPNPNLHSNAHYGTMTTTSILGGSSISLNITRLNNCFLLTPGSYKLGEIRFNRLDTSACIRLNIRTNSVLQDSITQMNYPGNWTFTTDTTCHRLDYLVGNENNAGIIPKDFKLYDNYPNPFNPSTKIKYDLPYKSLVKIAIYDIKGEMVELLENKEKEAGTYELEWNAARFASGTYIYRLESSGRTFVKKMILIK